MGKFEERIVTHPKVCYTCKHSLYFPPEYEGEYEGDWCCMLDVSDEDKKLIKEEVAGSTDGCGFYLGDWCWDHVCDFSGQFKQIMKLEHCANFAENGRRIRDIDSCQFHEQR